MNPFSEADLYAFMLAFTRTGGLILMFPVLHSSVIPRQLKLAIAVSLAMFIAPLIRDSITLPTHWLRGVLDIGGEMVAGVFMGMAARLLFFALELAGEIISTQIGLTMAMGVDPLTRTNATVGNTLLFSFGTLLFLFSGAYQTSILAFIRSFEIFPPGATFDPATVDTMVKESGHMFVLATLISGPLIASNFLVNFTFAALGRAAPTLNVFAASFGVVILAGFVVLSTTLPLIAQFINNELGRIPELMLRALR